MNEEPSKRSGWLNIVALGFVSFFTDISTEMILGVLPVFLVEELKASRVILGFVDGLADALNYLLRIFSGIISDKLGVRKKVVLLGYAISNIAKPLFAFAQTWYDVLIIRILDRMGKGVRTSARDALITESVSDKSIGKAFGVHRALDQLGAILGPVMASLIMPLIGIRGLFLVSFIPGIMALLVLIFLVKEVRRIKPKRGPILEAIRDVLTKPFTLFLLAVGTFMIGSYSFSFILLRSRMVGAIVEIVPLFYAVINVTHTLVAIPSGYLSDRLGATKTLIIGYLFFTLSSLLSIYADNIPLVIIVSLIYGLYMGITETVHRAAISLYSPSQLRGTAYGLLYIVIGTTSLISNLVFGLLWDIYGYSFAFTYSTIISIIGALLMFIASTQIKK